jgi:RimJ/RimL family protein N-acetyltransferase
MRHDVVMEGPAFRLRPVNDADAAFIVGLRGDRALNRYLHPGAQTVAEQLAWQAEYYERNGDLYFVVERVAGAIPEGLVALYDIDGVRSMGEWGRWILRSRSLAAVESAWLIYRAAFDILGFNEVYCRTVAENLPVIAFHDSCGISRQSLLPGHFRIGDRSVDAVEHRLTRDGWPAVSKRLDRLAELMARRLRDE